MSEYNDKLRTVKELHDLLNRCVDAGLGYNLIHDCIGHGFIKTFHEFYVAQEDIEWAIDGMEECGSSDYWSIINTVERTIQKERKHG